VGEGAELLEDAQLVATAPSLDDLGVLKAADLDAVDLDLLAGRGDALELTL